MSLSLKTLVHVKVEAAQRDATLDRLERFAEFLREHSVGRLMDDYSSRAGEWSRAAAARAPVICAGVDVGERTATPADLAAVQRCGDDAGLVSWEAWLPQIISEGDDDALADAFEGVFLRAAPRARTSALLPLLRAEVEARAARFATERTDLETRWGIGSARQTLERGLDALESWSAAHAELPPDNAHAEVEGLLSGLAETLDAEDPDDARLESVGALHGIGEVVFQLLSQRDDAADDEEIARAVIDAFLFTGAVIQHIGDDLAAPTAVHAADARVRGAIEAAIARMRSSVGGS